MATSGKRLTVICTLVLFTVQRGCFELFSCENEVISEVIAPDRERKAILFSRNCGATTAISYHVSVLPMDEGLGDQAGNVFVVERSTGLSAQVLVTWPNDTLFVHYDAPMEVFKQVPEIDRYPVEYTTGRRIDIKEREKE